VITGIAAGCRLAGCTLLGGETAEMPGFYPDGEYDLSGFCVGIVEKTKILTGEHIKEGDVLIGVASSGLHSNGFSLARKALFDELGYGLDDTPGEISRPLGMELQEPTRIYVKVLREAINIGGLKAASHITGGGLVENPVRCLPKNKELSVRLQRGSWPIPAIFQTISTAGVPEEEMYRTFNMGLGLVLFVDKNKAERMTRALNGAGELAWPVGEVVEDPKTPLKVFFD
jgi:phosphoribosylformylglycinamidine cyclo-ligase